MAFRHKFRPLGEKIKPDDEILKNLLMHTDAWIEDASE
jgi:hypothetical protein